MGPDSDDVVDPRLRVRGVNGLRVVDASVLPVQVAGNTQAPTMAIAWIAADLILEETAKMFGWTVDDLCGKSRRRPLVTARQIGMYVMRELTDFSYPRIA